MQQNMKILISTSDFLFTTDETKRKIHSLHYLPKLPTTPGHMNIWVETNYLPLNYCSKYHQFQNVLGDIKGIIAFSVPSAKNLAIFFQLIFFPNDAYTLNIITYNVLMLNYLNL